MSRHQRQGHAHLRRMATIRARRPYPPSKVKRERTLQGHERYSESYGDGYTEPREAWETCACGLLLWEGMHPYGMIEHSTWPHHLAMVKATRKAPLLHKGRKP